MGVIVKPPHVFSAGVKMIVLKLDRLVKNCCGHHGVRAWGYPESHSTSEEQSFAELMKESSLSCEQTQLSCIVCAKCSWNLYLITSAQGVIRQRCPGRLGRDVHWKLRRAVFVDTQAVSCDLRRLTFLATAFALTRRCDSVAACCRKRGRGSIPRCGDFFFFFFWWY